MNDIAPQQAFERALRLWWLIAACVFLGGLAGWTFSLFRAPVYEATAFYHVSVDSAEVARRLGRDPLEPLEFSQVRPYIDPVAAIFYQLETRDALLAAAAAQGIPAQAVNLQSRDLSLDRNGATWFVTVRNTDPYMAAQAANLWLVVVDARVQIMLVHAYTAESVEGVRSAVMGCLSSTDLEQANECAGTTFATLAEFQDYIDGLDRRVVAERLASGSLDTVLDVHIDHQAEPPARPVLYQRGALILAGSLAGLLAGLGILQFGIPGSRSRGAEMTIPMKKRPGLSILEYAAYAAVALAVLTLPFTSFPALSALMGGTLVAPISIVFVFLLLVGWLPVYLLKKGTLPSELKPWIAFGGVALLSSALAFFLYVPAFKNHALFPAEVDGLLTFGIAAATLLVFAAWIRRPGQLEWVLRWVNLGGMLLMAWCLAQLAIILLRGSSYTGLMVSLQKLVSIRSLQDHIFYTRLGGFSYEPSWLAHQLNVVYLPFWMAATLTGYSSFRKLWKISVENVLVLLGMVVLVFTYSRVGLLAIVMVLAYGLYRLNKFGIRWLQDRLNLKPGPARTWMTILALPVVFGLYALLVFGLLTLLARVDARIASLLAIRNFSLDAMEIASQMGLAERMIYWANGLAVFARFPLFGVGIGNTGFFFSQNLHLLGNRSGEILQVLNDAPYLPNIKSLWLRVMAETGLAGFSCFLAGYALLWRAGNRLTRNALPSLRAMGWMGIFVLIAFLAEGFSIDSFALPYLWFSLGLLIAASALARRSGGEPVPERSSAGRKRHV